MKHLTALVFVLLAGLAFAQTDLDGDNVNDFYNTSMDGTHAVLQDNFPEFEGLIECPAGFDFPADTYCTDDILRYRLEVELENLDNLTEAGEIEEAIILSNELANAVSGLSELDLPPTVLSQFNQFDDQFNEGLIDVSNGFTYLLTGFDPIALPPGKVSECENGITPLPVLNGTINVAPAGATAMASQDCADYVVSGLTGGFIDGFATNYSFDGVPGTYPVYYAGRFESREIDLEMRNTSGMTSLATTAHLHIFDNTGAQIDYRPLAVPAMGVDASTTISFEVPEDLDLVFTVHCDDCDPFTGVIGTVPKPRPEIIVTPRPRPEPLPPTDKPLPPNSFCLTECRVEKVNGTFNVFDEETNKLLFSVSNSKLAFGLADVQESLRFVTAQERMQVGGMQFLSILDEAGLTQYKVEAFNAYTYSTGTDYGAFAYRFGQFVKSGGEASSFEIGLDAEEVKRTRPTGPPTEGDLGPQACGHEGDPDCPRGYQCINLFCELIATPTELPLR